MGAALAWFLTVLVVFAGEFVFFHMGINLSAVLTAALSGLVHSLGQPIVLP